MIYQVHFHGTLTPETAARLSDCLKDAGAYGDPTASTAPRSVVRTEHIPTAACHRLGLDVCLSATGPRMALRHHTLHLRGMDPIKFLATSQTSSGAVLRHPQDPARADAIAWLASIARLRFQLTVAPSAHERRAAARAQAVRDAGTIAVSPLAFGDREIAAAMRVPRADRNGADFKCAVALLHTAAAPETLSPGWGAMLAAERL